MDEEPIETFAADGSPETRVGSPPPDGDPSDYDPDDDPNEDDSTDHDRDEGRHPTRAGIEPEAMVNTIREELLSDFTPVPLSVPTAKANSGRNSLGSKNKTAQKVCSSAKTMSQEQRNSSS